MSIINICHDFKYGKIIYNTRDRYIGRSLAAYGEYSQGEAELYKQLLRSGDTVIEVGANMGSLTVPLARFVGEAGRVIAFEPQRLIFKYWQVTRLSTVLPTSMPIIRASAQNTHHRYRRSQRVLS